MSSCSFWVYFGVLSIVLGLCSSGIPAGEQQPKSAELHKWEYFDQLPSPASKPLKVLLISIPAWGHIIPLLALGEELVLRGHEVTLCLGADDKRRVKVAEKLEQYGIKYHHFENDVMLTIDKNHDAPFLKKLFVFAGGLFSKYSADLMQQIHQSLSNGSYDIVLGNDFMTPTLHCINSVYGVPSVLMGTTLQIMPHHYPAWAWPGLALGASSDSLSFFQRMASVVDKLLMPVVMKYFLVYRFKSGLESFCPGVTLNEMAFSSGISFPTIVPTVIGFEYARTLFPMTEYVGPLISRSPAPLSEEMGEWLARKPDKSVVYVSMGSMYSMNQENGRAILEGVMKTNYSLLWSLPKSNQWILDGLEVDPDRVLLSEWTPQFSVLASQAIHSAILHGGFNGLSEALWNGVPVIGLPQMREQTFSIGRAINHGLALQLNSDAMSSSLVVDTLAAVDSGNLSRNVRQLQKLFRFAGGVRRAADLVEHYEDVGYAHLVPSYVKYRWNWIQYYNTDVYVALTVILGLVVMGFAATVKCVCAKCCSAKQKKE